MERWRNDGVIRRRKDKVLPAPHVHDVIRDTLQRWTDYLPYDASCRDDCVEVLCSQLSEETQSDPSNESNSLPRNVSTAIALDVALTVFQKVLPSSKLTQAITQTLLNAVYDEYDPEKSLLENRLRPTNEERSKEEKMTKVARTHDSCVDYEMMSRMWNQVVEEREETLEDTRDVECLLGCINTLSESKQLTILECMKKNHAHDHEVYSKDNNDPVDRRPAENAASQIHHYSTMDDAYRIDEHDTFADEHIISLQEDLVEIYRLLFIPDRRAIRNARYRLHVLLSQTFDSISFEDDDEESQLKQKVNDLLEHNPQALAHELLL